MSFDAGSVEARLTLSRDEFNRSLDQARADADKFASKPITAKITADGAQAKATLDDLTARADKLSGKAGTIKVSADATQANATLDATSAKADALGRKAASVKVQADASQANAALDATSAKADQLGAKNPTIKVSADTTGADADLDRTALKADALGRKTETVKVKTDTDTSGIDNLSSKISDLTSGPFSLLKTAIVGLGPAAVPVLGAVTAAVLPLGAAIGSAATGLGAFGLIAKSVLTQAATASTAAQTAQTAYTVAIDKTTGQYQAAMAVATTQAQRTAAYAAEQKGFAADRLTETAAQAKAYAGMSAQQIALSKQVGDLQTAWKGVLTSVTPLVSSALVPWMKDIQQLLQYIKPLITPIAALFKTWGDELGRALTGNQANLTRFFAAFGDRSAANIKNFGTALVEFAKGAGALIHDIAPYLAGASGGIAGLATSFAGWAKSQKTADDIKAFFAWAKAAAPDVKKLLEDLATTVGHLIAAMAYTGGGDLHVLAIVLGEIAKLPAAAIVALADAYVVLSLALRAAAAGAALWAAGETLVAAATTVLDAAETVYIALMLVADAVSLPLIVLIGGIVLAVAALAFGIYELVDHWKTSWHAILAAVDAVVGALKTAWDAISNTAVTAAGAVTRAFTATVNWLKGIFKDIAGPAIAEFNKIKTFVTSSFDAWWKSHGAEIKAVWNAIWTAVKDTFVPIWNTIVTVAKTGWAVMTAVFRAGSVAMTAVFRAGSAALTAVFTPVWNAIVAVAKTGWAVITGLFKVGAAVIAVVFKNAFAVLEAVAKVAWAAIQAVIKIAWDIIVGIFSVALGLVTGHWKQAWTDVTNTATQVWNALKQFFGTTLNAISGLFTQVLNNIKSFLAATWNAISSTAQSVWNAIKGFFTSWWSGIVSSFTSNVNTIKSVLSSAWNAMSSTAQSVWNGIKSTLSTILGGIQTGFSNAVNGIKSVWSTLQDAVRGPVSFIVNTVYDKGIVPVVNAVGSLIGMHLNTVSFAEGGLVTQGTGPKADDVLARISKGETVVSAEHSQKLAPIFKSVGVPGYAAGGVPAGRGAVLGAGNPTGSPGGVLGDIQHAVSGVGHAVTGAVGDIGKALANLTGDALAAAAKTILDPLLSAMPGGGTAIGAGLKKIPEKMVNGLVSKLKGTTPAAGAGGGTHVANVGSGVMRWDSLVKQALSMLHLPASFASQVEYQMMTESGGDPNVVNNWDSNAAAGTPSKGLMQVIGPTFAAYHVAGTSNNIYDPLANIAAAINYAEHAYGPSLGALGSGHGYDSGGWLQPGTTLVHNATGRPEPVLTGAQWDSLSGAMSGGDIGGKLDRIAGLLAAQPRATAAGMGEVLNGAARSASLRARYPRN